jgi:hypothetical protein
MARLIFGSDWKRSHTMFVYKIMHTKTKQESKTRQRTTTRQRMTRHESGDSLKSLLRSIAERGEHIPTEERERIPRDFAKNVDHYLYGAPKERE